MTATEKMTNQTVTITNQAKARQCGETPSWRIWSVLVFYRKGGFVLRYGSSADAETEKWNMIYCFKACQSFPRRKKRGEATFAEYHLFPWSDAIQRLR